MKIKFNNGNRALLCDNCRTIIATGERIPKSCVGQTEGNELFFCSEKCLENYKRSIENKSHIIKLY